MRGAITARRSTLAVIGLVVLTALTIPAAAQRPTAPIDPPPEEPRIEQMQKPCPAFSPPTADGKSGG